LDFGGRGDLSNRQIILKEHIKELSRIALVFNCIVLFTNQIMMNPNSMMGDPVKPVGGTVLSHTSKQIVYLRKGTKSKVVAKLVDSPDSAKNEAVLQLTKKGLEDGE
jgi:DNA repair protein RadA